MLYVTNLDTGTWRQIGKKDFANTSFMFSIGDSLYTIERSGTLYRVNAEDGSWTKVGPGKAWKATTVGVSHRGKIYTVETSGALFETDPQDGTWRQLGKAEFVNTKFMVATEERLYTVESDGSLFAVDIH